jgi:hypothetical protein
MGYDRIRASPDFESNLKSGISSWGQVKSGERAEEPGYSQFVLMEKYAAAN